MDYYRRHCGDVSDVFVWLTDDKLADADMDWQQLLAATFDPADPTLLLGPDEMFSLNRNDVLYAQKYAAARSTAAPPTAPPTATPICPPTGLSPSAQPVLDDHDIERCASDLDRFVNDLELACANIGQRSAEMYVSDDVTGETPAGAGVLDRGHAGDLDLGHAGDLDGGHASDLDLGYAGDLDLDQNNGKSSPPLDDRSDDVDVDHVVHPDLDEVQPEPIEPTNNALADDHQPGSTNHDAVAIDNSPQNSNDLVTREDGTQQVNSERCALSDLDPSNLGVSNGPDIALREMADDPPAAVNRFPYDPDPEATVV